MNFISKSTKLDERYAPPLNSEQVTPSKLNNLKAALWISYLGLPLSFFALLCMFILDNNHPIAESVPLALLIVGVFILSLGAFVYVAFSPIYRRLMNKVLKLDEGEVHLQNKAYSFAYGVIFKAVAFLILPIVIFSQIMTLDWIPLSFPEVDGSFVLLSVGLSVIFMLLLIIMLPMIYLVWNLKPVGEED